MPLVKREWSLSTEKSSNKEIKETKETKERKKSNINLIRLVHNGEVKGVRVCLRNTSDCLCVDTDYENLKAIQDVFSEDEIKWLKEEELSLQDGEYKTSTDREYSAMEVEDEKLLSIILKVEREAENFIEDHSEEGNDWFYVDLYHRGVYKQLIEFIKKWYFIRYTIQKSEFDIRLQDGGDDCYFKAVVSYSWNSYIEEPRKQLLSLLNRFNKTDKPIYMLARDSYEMEDWSIYDLDSYIKKGEPICYKFEEDEYDKYIGKVQLVYTDLTECADTLGCSDDEYDSLIVDQLHS